MGQPKGWLPFGGETMLQRVVRILGEVVNPIVVVAAPEQDLPPLPSDVRIVRDEVEGRGPLQGLAAGLSALEGQADAAFVASCDLPLLTAAFVRCVIAFLEQHEAVVPRVAGRVHPLAAVYHLSVLPHIRAMLTAGEFRLRDLCERIRICYLKAARLVDLDSLRNVNTPEEYNAALANLEPPP
jgi:molybdopterin-guanine dinucleotide biosynthesis protein A